MRPLIIFVSLVFLSGCASFRPQSRIIDATNKAPIFSRSVESAKEKEKTTNKKNKSKTSSKSKTTTYDFTF